MSATFNWAYKPGIANKYNLTVPAGPDNARPAGWCYIALFGSDATGNGSRQYPYKTITKAISVTGMTGMTLVLASGVYREAALITSTLVSNSHFIMIGDGDVAIDLSYNNGLFYTGTPYFYPSASGYNLEFRGTGSNYVFNGVNSANNGQGNKWIDCNFKGCAIAYGGNCIVMTNCRISNLAPAFIVGGNADADTYMSNCTLYNCNDIRFNSYVTQSSTQATSNIFYTCNISADTLAWLGSLRYSLFYHCNFKMTAGMGSGGALYPATPSGYTYYSTVSALQSALFATAAVNGFTGCAIADPLFNNQDIGDYSLSFASPAKNLSYFGTYVGAKSIAYQVKVSAAESAGSFDFSTNVNLAIADDSITLVDTTKNAGIKTKLIINVAGRQIQKFPVYGFSADRNGQYLDSTPDLDVVTKKPGDTLIIPAPYLIESGSVVYNGVTYEPGDRFTSVDGATTFSSVFNGVLREITEAPERHTLMARFSNGGNSVSAGSSLISGYWYYVNTGSIVYNGTTFNAGEGFKAVGAIAFSGSGAVIVAFGNEAYQNYDIGVQPTSNNVGNSRTGAILRGNGDPAYDRGGYGVTEFPINAKFIQLYYIISVSNLKP